jgi:hypothetical protein
MESSQENNVRDNKEEKGEDLKVKIKKDDG